MRRKRIATAAAAFLAVVGLSIGAPGAFAAAQNAGDSGSDFSADAGFSFTGKVTENTQSSIVPVHMVIMMDNSGSISLSDSISPATALAKAIFGGSTAAGTEVCFVTGNSSVSTKFGANQSNCATNVNGISSAINNSTSYGGSSDNHYSNMNALINLINTDTSNAKKAVVYIGDASDSNSSAAEDSWGASSWGNLKGKTDADCYIFANTKGSDSGGAKAAANNSGFGYFSGSNSAAWEQAFEDIGNMVSTTVETQREITFTIPFSTYVSPDWGTDGFTQSDVSLSVTGGDDPTGWKAVFDDANKTLTITLPDSYAPSDGAKFKFNFPYTKNIIPDCSKDYGKLEVATNPTVSYVTYIDEIAGEKTTKNVSIPTFDAVQRCTVKFDANTGAGTMSDWNVIRGETDTLPQKLFSKVGYTFRGWATSANGAVQYSDTDQYTGSSDETLYAQWDADPQSITYEGNANGVSGSTSDTDGVTDQTVDVAANGFTRDGYRFDCWNTKPDGTGTTYRPGDHYVLPAGGLTLYAQWRGLVNTMPHTGGNMNIAVPAVVSLALAALGGIGFLYARKRRMNRI